MQDDVNTGSLNPEPANLEKADGLINSRRGFHAVVREAFASLSASASAEVVICDIDFADWPLGEMSVIDSLMQWVRPNRRLTVYAQNFDEVLRRHPRWVTWRRQFAHRVECQMVEPFEQGRMPNLFTARGGTTIRMFDSIRYRGTVSTSVADAVLAREQIDVISQRSTPSFAATTLGL